MITPDTKPRGSCHDGRQRNKEKKIMRERHPAQRPAAAMQGHPYLYTTFSPPMQSATLVVSREPSTHPHLRPALSQGQRPSSEEHIGSRHRGSSAQRSSELSALDVGRRATPGACPQLGPPVSPWTPGSHHGPSHRVACSRCCTTRCTCFSCRCRCAAAHRPRDSPRPAA